MPPASGIVGRRAESEQFDSMCARVRTSGSALLIEGDPGVGKTALADHFAVRAAARGFRVLRTVGAPDEAMIPYSALHTLLRPLRDRFAGLPPSQREALDRGFGVIPGDLPSTFLAGAAALTLISDAAREEPLLVVADDLHWTDPASRQTLLMIARRIASDPIIMIMTARGGGDTIEAANIARTRLQPLDEEQSRMLLDQRPDRPTGPDRRILLERAGGNPLALVELAGPTAGGAQDDPLPLTHRLEQAFAGRFVDLPEAARLGVLAGAVGPSSTDELIVAVGSILGHRPESGWLDPARAAGLLQPGRGPIRFRHPLVRSAVVGVADPLERAKVLNALVDAIREPARTVWWRADLTAGADDGLADELAELGAGALEGGDPVLAARALGRAARLTRSPSVRARRLLGAADAAAQSGAHGSAQQLLSEADEATDDPRVRSRSRWMRELLPLEESALTHGDLAPAVSAIHAMRLAGDVEAALDALLHLSSIAWDHSSHNDPDRIIADASAAFDLDPDEPRALLLAAVSAPVERGDEVIARIVNRSTSDPDDAVTAWYLGYALNLCGEHELSVEYLQRAVVAFRATGVRALLPHALMGLSWVCFTTGRFAQGRACIDEVVTISADIEDPVLGGAARTALALYDAIDGTPPDRAAIIGSSPLAARALEAEAMRATIVRAEGLAALVGGRAREAADILCRLTDPGDVAYSLTARIFALPDIVDAAILAHRRPMAEAEIAEIAEIHRRWRAPMLEAVVAYARLVVIDDDQLEDVADALSEALPLTPYLRARALLAVGSRLRKQRMPARSRALLREALDLFDGFPARAWAERARDELRASGERLGDRPPSGSHLLTAQEYRVAELAADGLTNREIAERLFLSPRTIGAHLYTTFRKLGVTSRTQLAGVLKPGEQPPRSPI